MPDIFIVRMVTTPVDITLKTAEPEIEPNRLDAMIDTLALVLETGYVPQFYLLWDIGFGFNFYLPLIPVVVWILLTPVNLRRFINKFSSLTPGICTYPVTRPMCSLSIRSISELAGPGKAFHRRVRPAIILRLLYLSSYQH